MSDAERAVIKAARMLDKAIMSAHALPSNEDAGHVINAMWIEMRNCLKQLDAADCAKAKEAAA